jgi:hypothetical protein
MLEALVLFCLNLFKGIASEQISPILLNFVAKGILEHNQALAVDMSTILSEIRTRGQEKFV